MTLADYSMTAFALLNGGRIAAYFPQMLRVYRDPHGATAVSLLTWTLFAAANVATVSYALTLSDDRIVAIVFLLNAIGCIAIVGLTAFKRNHVARPGAMLRHWVASLRQSQNLVERNVLAEVGSPCCGRDCSSSARQGDHMIRQGLTS
jgi:hypothetical protein